jgi:carbamoyl-phosphate synthase large subunit
MGKTILVSGASGIVGYGILKSLKDKGHNLIGTTIYDDSVAEAFCDTVIKVLPTSHPAYIEVLCDVIERHHVDMIISGIECDMYKWNQEREKLWRYTFPLLNNPSLIELCDDKWKFYEALVDDNPKYAIPTTLDKHATFNIPNLLLKPRHGFGSKGIIKIKTFEDFLVHQEDVGEKLMIQPIIGTEDEEYTVSGFFDRTSNLVDYFPLKRKLSKDGFTQQAEVEDRNFGEVLIDLAKTFKPIGATNFQFRFDGEQPKLLEINPRISSATSIRILFGYNEAEMSVEYFLNGKLPPKEKRLIFKEVLGRKAIRYTEDYIF